MKQVQRTSCRVVLRLVCAVIFRSCLCSAAAAVAYPSSLRVHTQIQGSSTSSSIETTSALLGRPLHTPSAVPGQAFHDWRKELITKKFSNDNVVTNKSSSSSSSAAGQQLQWINIVGLRDQLPTMYDPRAVNTSNRAAAYRLTVATRRLQEATARRTAAAAAAAAAEEEEEEEEEEAAEVAAEGAVAAVAANADAVLEGDVRLPPSESAANGQLQQSPGGSSSSSSGDSSSNHYPSVEEIELTMMSYVTRDPAIGTQLQLNGKPWLMTGFDIPNALALAVHNSTRHQVLYLMDEARRLGFNTVRFWGFADGGMKGIGSAAPTVAWEQQQKEQQRQQQDDGIPRLSLQPAPGILNSTALSAGLDWVVHAAGLRGLKLVIVLTNGATAAQGGMQQYVDWVDPALTVTDFYTNDTVKSVFLDYVAALLSHKSSLSGVPLREDPLVAAWQLTEGAAHPGHPSSEPLLAWLKQLGVYLKEQAPHQLVLSGLEGYFGLSSPHHMKHNPYAQVFGGASRTPHVYSGLCEGTDFWLHHQLPELDVATAAVLPDKWLACDSNCKLDWARQWIRAHLREAVRLQKPLLLSGVAALRPQAWRSQVLQLVQQEVARAVQAGHPIAGAIVSGLSHPSAADASGWAIYTSAEAVHKATAPLADTTKQAVQEVTWRRFMNYDDYLYCLTEALRGEDDDTGRAVNTAAWVDGWQDVIAAVEGVGQLSCGLPGSAYSSACRKQQAAGAKAVNPGSREQQSGAAPAT